MGQGRPKSAWRRRPCRIGKSLLEGRRRKGEKPKKGKTKLKDCLACSVAQCEQRWDQEKEIWVGPRICKNCTELESRRYISAFTGE